LTNAEFLNAYALRTGLSRRDASKVIDVILRLIEDTLRGRQDVTFKGFGKFSLQSRAARQGVNPRNPAQRVTLPSATVPKFSAASELKAAVRTAGQGARLGGVGAGNRRGSRPKEGPRSETKTSPRSRAPGEKRLNAWISGRQGVRRAPLRIGETYRLNFNAGRPVDSKIVEGDTSLDRDALPPEGLDTDWIVTSRSFAFASVGRGEGDVAVSRGKDPLPWSARFSLHIPRDSDSETRMLDITPLPECDGRVDVAIMVGSEVYRQLSLSLEIAGDGARRRQRVARIVRDAIETPALHTRLRPSHEWTTPPGELTVLVRQDAWVKGSTGGESPNESTVWHGYAAGVAKRINDVRQAAEGFRGKYGRYLNDLPPDDLRTRLERFAPTRWGDPPKRADEAHQKAWRDVARSPELRTLAKRGRLLYDAFFPEESELRRWIDALGWGHRLDITWQNINTGWVPGVPWGLMYSGDPPREGKPVDPMQFLALRLRIAYSSYLVNSPSKALGASDKAHCGNLLYWGSAADDATGEASQWQRAELENWANQLFWPASGKGDPMDQMARALERPSPPPVTVLYLYCQSTFGVQGEQVLGFDEPVGPTNALDLTDLGFNALKDRPFVFANACTTAANDPYFANDLEKRFFERGARAFLGTETKVPIQLASRFARVFFHFFYRKADPALMAAGEAVVQARQFLWHNYLNIGGIFYAYVNEYELYLGGHDEVVKLAT
jgi:nucleoid DNA-binding protein